MPDSPKERITAVFVLKGITDHQKQWREESDDHVTEAEKGSVRMQQSDNSEYRSQPAGNIKNGRLKHIHLLEKSQLSRKEYPRHIFPKHLAVAVRSSAATYFLVHQPRREPTPRTQPRGVFP